MVLNTGWLGAGEVRSGRLVKGAQVVPAQVKNVNSPKRRHQAKQA
jgi:hypothetical protein